MKPGDTLIDNDPRMPGRRLVIESLGVITERGTESVVARSVYGRGRLYTILVRRIHSDGKPRRSGFTLVAQEGKAS